MNKRNRLKISVLSMMIVAVSLPVFGNVAATVSTRLDSTDLLMGKQTVLHIEILQGKDDIGGFTNEQSDTLCRYVEIVGRPDADTVDLGNGRIQINRKLVLQSFDSGLYVLPPLQYVIGNDTFKSSQLSLRVMPVNVDTLTNIHGFKPVEEFPFNFLDLLPNFIVDYWWVYLLIILIAVSGVLVYIFLIKKGNKMTAVPKILIPPYEEAMQRLEELKNRKLWQSGQEKEYYTQLTDILRNYIDRRFDINAMEMTSSQIISVLRKNNETKAVNEQLGKILEMADFVKFAKVRPLPDDNEISYQRAINFVNETRPVPSPEESAKSEGTGEVQSVNAEGGQKS